MPVVGPAQPRHGPGRASGRSPTPPASTGGTPAATQEARHPANVKHLSNTRYDGGMPGALGFRPTQDDKRILREAARPGESTSDTLRRALRLLDHDRWLTQFKADAETLKDEDLNATPEAW